MTVPAQRTEWIPARVAQVALAVSLAGFIAHAFVGLQGAYLTYGSGVWLTLARDLSQDGVFYRDLVSDLGYGGTRYFPLFFVSIAAFLKAGLGPVAAGLLAGSLSLFLLAVGAYRVARAGGAPALTAGLFAAAAATPYFGVQAAFELRADVLAAGLNLLGVSMVLPAWIGPAGQRDPRLRGAALVFVVAFATKVTALTIPVALVFAAILTGRGRIAATLSGLLVAGAVAFLAVVQLASGGRAFRVWAAVMFAGSDSTGTIMSVFGGGFFAGLLNSHLVVVAAIVAVAALVAGALGSEKSADGENALPVPASAAIWIGATATLALTLSSPGTVPANQVIEWLAVSMLIPVLVAGTRVSLQKTAAILAVAMAVWMSGQNVMRSRERALMVASAHRAATRAFVERVRTLNAPILAESALWPILAEREVIVPDAFAARVVLRERAGLEASLVAEIEAQRYGGIVLEFDPSSKEGQAMYENSHFTPAVIAAIRARYRLEPDSFGMGFVFVPSTPQRIVDTPRVY